MLLSTKLKDHLKAIDESATLYLTATSVLLFDWQKEAIREAVNALCMMDKEIALFLDTFNPKWVCQLYIEQKIFLIEQFELVIHGKEQSALEATSPHSEEK